MSLYEIVNVNKSDLKSKYPLGVHEDGRRKLTAVFNGDFNALQVKVVEVKDNQALGGHAHFYRELFYIFRGHTTVLLEKDSIKETLELFDGDRLIIAPEVFHIFWPVVNTVIIEATEGVYVSPEVSDIK